MSERIKIQRPSNGRMDSSSCAQIFCYYEELESGKYYKLIHKSTVPAIKYLRLSLIGEGENLIVTINEPIVVVVTTTTTIYIINHNSMGI